MTKETIYTALMKCEFKKVKVEGNNAMFNAKYMKVRLLNLVPDESTDDDGNESSKSGTFQKPRKVIRKDNYGI